MSATVVWFKDLGRREDGIHFTAAGGDRLARVVMAAMADDWHIGEEVP